MIKKPIQRNIMFAIFALLLKNAIFLVIDPFHVFRLSRDSYCNFMVSNVWILFSSLQLKFAQCHTLVMKIIAKHKKLLNIYILHSIWTASSEFGTYRLCEQRRFRRACASAQSRQNLCCSLIQAVSQAEPSDRKPDPWSLWMAGHAQLKFVMTECSKTQIRLTGPISWRWSQIFLSRCFAKLSGQNNTRK